jgi:hypothetical protein
MIWGDWTHPLAFVLLGAVLVVVGLISWDGSCGSLAAGGACGIALDKEPRGAVRSNFSRMKKRLAKKRLTAIFIYADGCSLRLDHLLGDPPPRQAVLRTEARFKEGIFRFRLRVVRWDCSEAWYEEAGKLPSEDEP